MSKLFLFFLFLVPCSLCLFSCNSSYTAGKKKGYFKIDFPKKEYQDFNEPGYPYTFQYPDYAHWTKDTAFFGDKAGDWWINIDIPQFSGRIYISYKEIGKANNFDSLREDARKMAYQQHMQIATGIQEIEIQKPGHTGGIFYELSGNTATASQFFVTDSTKHFLRGALYFDATPNADSLGIVNDFLKKDLLHLINTLKWK